jgi:hypothetical protein
MHPIKALTVAIAMTSIAACSVTSTNEVVKPVEQASGPFGMFTHDAVNVEGGKAFVGVKKVVIGSFKIGFITTKKEHAQAGGSGVGGNSTAMMELHGITPAVMQSITDKAYQDLLAQLQAAGYEVADRTQLASSEFGKSASKASPFTEEASFFGSDNTVTYVAPASIGNLYFFMGETDQRNGFNFNTPDMAASGFADKNKLPVISVMYNLDFSSNKSETGAFASFSAVEVGQALSVAPGSGIILIGGQGGTFSTTNGSVRLGQAIASPDPFGEIVNTSSDGMVVLETTVNAASALLGGGTNQSRDFSVAADPAKYSTGAANILKQTNADLIRSMQAAK